jgi:hypothetical protein
MMSAWSTPGTSADYHGAGHGEGVKQRDEPPPPPPTRRTSSRDGALPMSLELASVVSALRVPMTLSKDEQRHPVTRKNWKRIV